MPNPPINAPQGLSASAPHGAGVSHRHSLLLSHINSTFISACTINRKNKARIFFSALSVLQTLHRPGMIFVSCSTSPVAHYSTIPFTLSNSKSLILNLQPNYRLLPAKNFKIPCSIFIIPDSPVPVQSAPIWPRCVLRSAAPAHR